MPFLRAAAIAKDKARAKKTTQKHGVNIGGVTVIKTVGTSVTKIKNEQLLIFPPNSTQDTSKTKSTYKSNTQKGDEYEEYVGSLYQDKGWEVEYNGIKKRRWDGTIDLICRYGRYTVLAQCKCYSPGSNIRANDVYQFYGAYRHYAVKHQKEVVQAAYWTSLDLSVNSQVIEAITELGIVLYDGVELKK